MPETNQGARDGRPSLRKTICMRGGALLFLAVAIALGVRFYQHEQPLVMPVAVPQTQAGGQLQTQTEAKEIFQRAFWQRPSEADKLLNGERREWANAEDGVRKWQWFLAVEPSPTLVAELKQKFSLTPAAFDPKGYADAPEWFRSSLRQSATVWSSGDGGLEVIVSPDQKQMLAFGMGHGFATAAAQK